MKYKISPQNYQKGCGKSTTMQIKKYFYLYWEDFSFVKKLSKFINVFLKNYKYVFIKISSRVFFFGSKVLSLWNKVIYVKGFLFYYIYLCLCIRFSLSIYVFKRMVDVIVCLINFTDILSFTNI